VKTVRFVQGYFIAQKTGKRPSDGTSFSAVEEFDFEK
jgi:hypothetical protein